MYQLDGILVMGGTSGVGCKDVLYLGKGHEVMMLELQCRVTIFGCALYWCQKILS